MYNQAELYKNGAGEFFEFEARYVDYHYICYFCQQDFGGPSTRYIQVGSAPIRIYCFGCLSKCFAKVQRTETAQTSPIMDQDARDAFIRKHAAEALDTAKKLITQDRAEDYGSAEENFDLVAQYWTIHLRAILKFHGVDPETFGLSEHDVGIMMTQFKLARIWGPFKADNYDDGIGYLALAKGLAKLGIEDDKELESQNPTSGQNPVGDTKTS